MPVLPNACASLGLGAVTRVRAIAEGTHHLVWKVSSDEGEFALRASAASDPRARRNRERLWRTVGELGVAPAYRGSKRIQSSQWDGWIEAFDWIDGRPLNPARDHFALARTLAHLHNLPLPSRSKFSPKIDFPRFVHSTLVRDLRKSKGGGILDRLLRDNTEQAIRAPQSRVSRTPPTVLVHNDLVDANVINGPDGICLIDWDWAMTSSPEVDLFCFLSPFVRSWRAKPRYVATSHAAEFLTQYQRNLTRRRPLALSGWRPYNVLLANWLRRQPKGPSHATDPVFYKRAFRNVDELAVVLDSIK